MPMKLVLPVVSYVPFFIRKACFQQRPESFSSIAFLLMVYDGRRIILQMPFFFYKEKAYM